MVCYGISHDQWIPTVCRALSVGTTDVGFEVSRNHNSKLVADRKH